MWYFYSSCGKLNLSCIWNSINVVCPNACELNTGLRSNTYWHSAAYARAVPLPSDISHHRAPDEAQVAANINCIDSIVSLKIDFRCNCFTQITCRQEKLIRLCPELTCRSFPPHFLSLSLSHIPTLLPFIDAMHYPAASSNLNHPNSFLIPNLNQSLIRTKHFLKGMWKP